MARKLTPAEAIARIESYCRHMNRHKVSGGDDSLWTCDYCHKAIEFGHRSNCPVRIIQEQIEPPEDR